MCSLTWLVRSYDTPSSECLFSDLLFTNVKISPVEQRPSSTGNSQYFSIENTGIAHAGLSPKQPGLAVMHMIIKRTNQVIRIQILCYDKMPS